jgi:outer membrane protein TolC
MSGNTRDHLARRRLRAAIFASAVTFGWAIPAAAQYSGTNAAASQSSPLSGSVPSGPASSEILRLTLRDAITRGLRYNLATIESGQNAELARGQRLLALSNLLPQVSAGASETVQQVNLGTLGLSGLNVPGIPPVVGPFGYSSVDASISQTLFSFESIQRFRAARTAEQAAQLSYQDILDVVTLSVGNAYLQIIEASSRILAQEAQVQNARALYDRAFDQVQAGSAPRIDATRTEVQLHTEEYNLSVARNNFEIAKLVLGRVIGLPLGQQFELSDTLPYSDIPPLTADEAMDIAYKARSDLRSALDSQKSAAQTLSAAKGERYPTVAVNGDYGDLGSTFGHSHGEFTFQAGIRVPLFTGGRIKGDVTQAEANLRQKKAEAENIRDRSTRTSAQLCSTLTQRKSRSRSPSKMSSLPTRASLGRRTASVPVSRTVLKSSRPNRLSPAPTINTSPVFTTTTSPNCPWLAVSESRVRITANTLEESNVEQQSRSDRGS